MGDQDVFATCKTTHDGSKVCESVQSLSDPAFFKSKLVLIFEIYPNYISNPKHV